MAAFYEVRNEVFDLHYGESFTFLPVQGTEHERWLDTLFCVGDALRLFLEEQSGDTCEPSVFDFYGEVIEEDRVLFLEMYAARMAE